MPLEEMRGAERRKALTTDRACEARGIPCDRDARLTALHCGGFCPRVRASRGGRLVSQVRPLPAELPALGHYAEGRVPKPPGNELV